MRSQPRLRVKPANTTAQPNVDRVGVNGWCNSVLQRAPTALQNYDTELWRALAPQVTVCNDVRGEYEVELCSMRCLSEKCAPAPCFWPARALLLTCPHPAPDLSAPCS